MNDKQQENVTPIVISLSYEVRSQLGVTWLEYVYLNMIYALSYNRWCIKSLENSAVDMGITKRGLIKLRDRLIAKGYIEKNKYGHLKVTPRYIGVAVNKVHQPGKQVVNKVPKSVNKVHRGGELSSPKSYNRVIESNRKNEKEGSSGYDVAQAIYAELKARKRGKSA